VRASLDSCGEIYEQVLIRGIQRERKREGEGRREESFTESGKTYTG